LKSGSGTQTSPPAGDKENEMTKEELENIKSFKRTDCDDLDFKGINMQTQADIAFQLTRIADALEEWMKPRIEIDYDPQIGGSVVDIH